MSGFSLEHLSQPIVKLIETIGNGIGIWFEPKRIKRNAKANGEAFKILAKAKVEAQAIQDESLRGYYLALEEERLLRDFNKKRNRDNIILFAAEELNGKTVNEKGVDGDWVAQFIDYSENTSNEEMQLLWAKLLAGEVQNPGTFSKRALSTLYSMSYEEAKAFYDVSIHSFKNENGDIVLPKFSAKYLSDLGKSKTIREKVKILQTLNLIGSNDLPGLRFSVINDRGYAWVSYFDYGIKINSESKDFKGYSQYGLVFSHLGKELYNLVQPNEDMSDYLREFINQIVENNQNKDFIVEFGKLKSNNCGHYSFEKSQVIRV